MKAQERAEILEQASEIDALLGRARRWKNAAKHYRERLAYLESRAGDYPILEILLKQARGR